MPRTKAKTKKPHAGAGQKEFNFQNPSFEQLNNFEKAIDEMMASEAVKRYPQLADLISRSFKNNFEKRQAILAALENDRPLFSRLNRKLGAQIRIVPSDAIGEIVEMLREYVKVGDTERKLYGEVMTPIPLVEEMLDGLPKNVWSNPDLKWLDPANGCGIFPAVIVKRLMEGLKEWQPNEEYRYAHIMENMIHVCELQPKNMFLYLCAFDTKDKYALKVYTGSFLDEGFDRHAQEQWGINKFDVIVGNPPYQVQKEGNTKTQQIWPEFALKSIDIMATNGFLVSIHPAGWRNKKGLFKKVQNRLKTLKIRTLNIHDVNDGIKTFGATTRFDFYTAQNVKNNGAKTKIRCQDGTTTWADISSLDFIPNGDFKRYFSLCSKDEEKTNVFYGCYYHAQSGKKNGRVRKEPSSEYKFPLARNVSVNGKPSTTFYTNVQKTPYFGKPKIILTLLGEASMIDEDGNCGMCEHCFAILDEPKLLPKINTALRSTEFIKFMRNMNIGGQAGNIYSKDIMEELKKDFWKEFI